TLRLPHLLLRREQQFVAKPAVRTIPRPAQAASRGAGRPVFLRRMAVGPAVACSVARATTSTPSQSQPVTWATSTLTGFVGGWYIFDSSVATADFQHRKACGVMKALL